MPKCWSISTTIRNPERNVPFLKALSRYEGQIFNESIQSAFFKELIKIKAYRPNGISEYYIKKYEEPEEFTNEEVADILSSVHYSNKQYNDDQESIYAFRGRTAIGTLNKMGLVKARVSMGKVEISDLGREVMSGTADLSNVFLRYCLKWQLPNLLESGYKEFSIRPFIGVLHVIDKVNQIWEELGNKPIGVSQEEFSLFLIPLIDYKNIYNVCREIINYRKYIRTLNKEERYKFVSQKFIDVVIDVFELEPNNEIEINKKINNLMDYSDSAIRYFRQTKLIYYRGNGRYIDLAPTRIVEIRSILNNFDGSIMDFIDTKDYLDYMADINSPQLPWENIKELEEVYRNLLDKANELQNKIEKTYKGQAMHEFKLNHKKLASISDYNNEIDNLRSIIKTLNNDAQILKERNLENIDNYIDLLLELSNRKRSISGQDPLNLEWYTTLCLMALDDAKEISPNYSIGDDNIPIFTAPGNTPDIECYYKDINMVCEVTLLRGRDQWFNEGQPVMRHLRDFEVSSNKEDNYCLFIAPIIHRDTLNTFWMSIKLGYEGRQQKIIPLSIEQFSNILKGVKNMNNKHNIRITHKDIKNLLDKLIDSSERLSSSIEWIDKFDDIICEWGNKSYVNTDN